MKIRAGEGRLVSVLVISSTLSLTAFFHAHSQFVCGVTSDKTRHIRAGNNRFTSEWNSRRVRLV